MTKPKNALARDRGAMYLASSLLFEDERIYTLSSDTFRIWMYLLLGRCRTRLPGLVATSTVIITERTHADEWGQSPWNTGPRPSGALVVQTAIDELLRLGRIQFDAGKQLIRIPNGPRYADCPNTNILHSWFRIWLDLPRSPLKYDHLASLHADLISQASREVNAVWDATFGPHAEAYRRQPELGAQSGTIPGTLPGTIPGRVRDRGEGREEGSGSERGKRDLDLGSEIEGSGNPSGNPSGKGSQASVDRSEHDESSSVAENSNDRFPFRRNQKPIPGVMENPLAGRKLGPQ